MNSKQADTIIQEYMKKIYGFVLGRTANLQDAEDLTQEIILKLYIALLVKEINDINAFVWSIAHNILVNYYRSKAKRSIGISISDLENVIYNDDDPAEQVLEAERIRKLQSEIAYLSKTQRSIVIMYYYEGKKQNEIADILSIPVGTVKWHMFNAKQEMKKGMEKMRNVSELKFNPIKFSLMGLSGSVGTMGGTSDFFRSVLSQNIAYCVYHEAKTINEIAECLGVSPVYIESEVEFLAEYGFLLKRGDKYLTNMIIDEPSERDFEIAKFQEELYTKAAKLISYDLYDQLMGSQLLDSNRLYYPDGDKNFLAWALLPFLLSWSKEGFKENIKFDEVATIRKDGGTNIANASIDNGYVQKHKYLESMHKWCGPMWNGLNNGDENILLWQINSEWSSRDLRYDDYNKQIERDLRLLHRFTHGEVLSIDEYAYMIQKGYLKKVNGSFELAIIWLKDKNIRQELLDICNEIRRKHKDVLEPLIKQYCKAVIEKKPKHIQKMQAYGLQHTLYSDGWFLLYTIQELLACGRLNPPREDQRLSLSTLIMPND